MNEKLQERIRAGIKKLTAKNRSPVAICITSAAGQKWSLHATSIEVDGQVLDVRYVEGDSDDYVTIESVESQSTELAV
jgi:hypothetical protein